MVFKDFLGLLCYVVIALLGGLALYILEKTRKIKIFGQHYTLLLYVVQRIADFALLSSVFAVILTELFSVIIFPEKEIFGDLAVRCREFLVFFLLVSGSVRALKFFLLKKRTK